MVQVYFIGSKASAMTYANTVVKTSKFNPELTLTAIENLYVRAFHDGEFVSPGLINAEIKIKNPPHWDDDKGFQHLQSFLEWLDKGPISLVATKDIKIGQEIFAVYPFSYEGEPNQENVESESSEEDPVDSEEEEEYRASLKKTASANENQNNESDESDTDTIRGKKTVTTLDELEESLKNAVRCAHRVQCTSQGNSFPSINFLCPLCNTFHLMCRNAIYGRRCSVQQWLWSVNPPYLYYRYGNTCEYHLQGLPH
jgi:hypothetical protein